jgi:hypothetical protein
VPADNGLLARSRMTHAMGVAGLETPEGLC